MDFGALVDGASSVVPFDRLVGPTDANVLEGVSALVEALGLPVPDGKLVDFGARPEEASSVVPFGFPVGPALNEPRLAVPINVPEEVRFEHLLREEVAEPGIPDAAGRSSPSAEETGKVGKTVSEAVAELINELEAEECGLDVGGACLLRW